MEKSKCREVPSNAEENGVFSAAVGSRFPIRAGQKARHTPGGFVIGVAVRTYQANVAVKSLTAEQAGWTDGGRNHSVGQLAYHIELWNQQNLAQLKGENLEKFSGNNDETFDKLN